MFKSCSLKPLLCSFLLLISFTLLAACGGGGGGGGDESISGGDRFGVRVLHGGLEIAPVEYADPSDETVLERAQFLSSALYSSAPEGVQTISFFRANSGGTRFVTSLSLSIEPETRYTVFLFGDQTELGPRTSVFVDGIPSLEGGEAAIRYLNGVDAASSITVGGTAVSFGDISQYETVMAGDLSFEAVRTADGTSLTGGTVTLEEGRAYTVLVAGEAEIFVSSQLYTDS